MLNYEHEIGKTRDKYINSILWCDYFHDSLLKDIRIENFWKDIYFLFSCEREWGEWINLFNCSETVDYDYELHFHDCKHFESNLLKDVDYIEYLNGRFKNSAKLKNLSKFTHKKYFHFRMQLTAGICDIIFNKFSIRKISWTISIPNYFKFTNHFDLLKKELSQLDISTIIDNARGEDDFERAEALEYLWIIWNSQTRLLTINALKNAVTYDFTWVSAIFILWEIWTIEDIPSLKKKFDELDKYETMWTFHINDALEKIIYRTNNKNL